MPHSNFLSKEMSSYWSLCGLVGGEVWSFVASGMIITIAIWEDVGTRTKNRVSNIISELQLSWRGVAIMTRRDKARVVTTSSDIIGHSKRMTRWFRTIVVSANRITRHFINCVLHREFRSSNNGAHIVIIYGEIGGGCKDNTNCSATNKCWVLNMDVLGVCSM